MKRKWLYLGLGLLGPIGLYAAARLWIDRYSGRLPEGATLETAEGARPGQPGSTLRVLSWNIHYGYGPTFEQGRGATREEVMRHLEGIADRIRAWDPDVVALQEVDRGAMRSHDIDQLQWLREATGLPYTAWAGTWEAGWVPFPGLRPDRHIGRVRSGQAILSRYPLENPQRHALPQPGSRSETANRFYLHRALLEVELPLGERRIRLYNLHADAYDVPNKMEHARITRARVEEAGGSWLLLGDMNAVPPEAALRAAFPDEPETDMSEDSTIELLRGIHGGQEIVPPDVYRGQESAWFTFPTIAPNRRLDYIFHSQDLRLLSARVRRVEASWSDHLPLLAELVLP
jgi:endonuclease/exonuclease/phosphatase family metal-dependent hydrolase